MAAIFDFNQYPKIPVGVCTPKKLPDVPEDEFLRMRGEPCAQGSYAIIYKKNGDPKRLYKVIPIESFNGDEVRAAKAAGKLGVAPAFHGAFKAGSKVIIEMDKGYPKLGISLEALSASIDNAPGGRVSITRCAKILFGDFNKHYPGNKKPDDLFLEVFSKVKVLAKKFFTYTDPNAGNILLDFQDTGDTQLIDFGLDKKTESVEEAVREDFKSLSFLALWSEFKEMPNLSQESQDLIEWFESRR